MNNDRIVFADYLRVVACFLVMLVHASENFYGADATGLAGSYSMLANGTNRFWVAFYDGFVARTCVPVFMVLSAFLLVPMKSGQTMGQFYKRRFSRILPPLLFFMVLYCIIPVLWGGLTPDRILPELAHLPWNFPDTGGHLWFMYPLISIYLIIPVVSPWLERATAKEERLFLGIFIISTFIPFIKRFVVDELWGECFWNGFSALWYCSGYLGYLVMAHYIRVHLKWDDKKKLRIGAACFLTGAAFTGWSFWFMGTPGKVIETPMLEWAWEFCTPNVLLATFGIFLMFSCIRRETAPRAVTDLSKLSFGMYLMHMLFLAPISKWIVDGDQANPLIPIWASIPAIALMTFVCCAVTTKLLSYIPGSKWFIGVHSDSKRR